MTTSPANRKNRKSPSCPFLQCLVPLTSSAPGETFKFTNGRGEALFARYVPPKSAGGGKAIVLHLHGLGEHCSSKGCDNYFKRLSEAGFHVFGYDHTGHGQTAHGTDRFGLVEHWSHLVDDAIHFLLYGITAEKYGHLSELPFFISGTSLGGMINLHVSTKVQEHQMKSPSHPLWKRFCGTLLFAPAIYQTLSPSWYQVLGLKVLRLAGFGKHRLGPASDGRGFPDVQTFQEFRNDPYCKADEMVLDTGFTLLEMTEFTQQLLPRVNFPFAVFHGTDDCVIPFHGSEELIRVSQTPVDEKTLVKFEGASHCLLIDTKSAGIFDEALSWMNARLAFL